jgi:hypothetical protein
MKRSHISLKTKLASALLAIKAFELGRWSPLIPHEDAKQMTADQIISLFAFDHYPIRKADGGPDEPWNLEPRMIVPHREKTAKIDVPQMAKSKRIRRKEATHRERINLSAINEELNALKWNPPLKRRILSRPFPKNKRKLRSNKTSN